MKRILKFEIAVGSMMHLNIDHDDHVIHVGEQHSQGGKIVTFWVESDGRNVPRPERHFLILPTGADIPDNYKHHGTAICQGGALVWHLYEVLG
jgi:hypothetical protein